MKKVFSMVAMMVFLNAVIAMAASDFVSNNRQDVTLRDGKSQVELMGDRHADPEKIDPARVGVRVWKTRTSNSLWVTSEDILFSPNH